MKRQFRPEDIAAITRQLTTDQGGRCGCCNGEPGPSGLTIEWSLDETDDDGTPMLRGVLCRRCKIAVNRYIRPSKFTLVPSVHAMVEAYVQRSWQDPRAILRRLGVVARDKVAGAVVERVHVDVVARISTTEDIAAWLESLP